jgi:hypothetical protein
MWQRLGEVKIPCDFVILGTVKNKGKLKVVVPSADNRCLVVIGFTQITSKPKLVSPSDMSYAGVLCIIAFRGFWDFG